VRSVLLDTHILVGGVPFRTLVKAAGKPLLEMSSAANLPPSARSLSENRLDGGCGAGTAMSLESGWTRSEANLC